MIKIGRHRDILTVISHNLALFPIPALTSLQGQQSKTMMHAYPLEFPPLIYLSRPNFSMSVMHRDFSNSKAGCVNSGHEFPP